MRSFSILCCACRRSAQKCRDILLFFFCNFRVLNWCKKFSVNCIINHQECMEQKPCDCGTQKWFLFLAHWMLNALGNIKIFYHNVCNGNLPLDCNLKLRSRTFPVPSEGISRARILANETNYRFVSRRSQVSLYDYFWANRRIHMQTQRLFI